MLNKIKMKPLLVLDLDQTLISTVNQHFEKPTFSIQFPDWQGHFKIRPMVVPTLNILTNWYQIAIWTGGGQVYADAITQEIWKLLKDVPPPVAIWSSNHVTEYKNFFYKDLGKYSKLGFDLKRVILVDDADYNFKHNPKNTIQITPYFSSVDEYNGDFFEVYKFLSKHRDVEVFQTLDYVNWRAGL